MATKIEAARLLRIKAARMLDQGMNVTKKAVMAKVFAAEAYYWVVSEAIRVQISTKEDLKLEEVIHGKGKESRSYRGSGQGPGRFDRKVQQDLGGRTDTKDGDSACRIKYFRGLS